MASRPLSLLQQELVDEDRGYLSLSTPSSSPLPGTSKGELLHADYGRLESPSEPSRTSNQGLAPLNEDPDFLVLDFCDSGDEEPWSVGRPLFESSVCHQVKVTVRDGSTERTRRVSDESAKSASESVQAGQTLSAPSPPVRTPEGGGRGGVTFTCIVSGDSLKVKSKIVVPSGSLSTAGTPSSISLDGAEWEARKEQYVNLVRRHMNEKTENVPGAVSELVDLMTHVADQAKGSRGRTWQHPSDFTRRNYQKRFGNTEPRVSLLEWQAKSNKTLGRFSGVPKTGMGRE